MEYIVKAIKNSHTFLSPNKATRHAKRLLGMGRHGVYLAR